MSYILFGLWYLMAIMGQDFVEKNIVGPINPFFILLGFSLFYYLFYKIMFKKHKLKNDYDDETNKLFKTFKIFIIFELLFVLISFLNFPSIFGIKNLPFSKSYIIRQSYFIYGFSISACVFLSLKNNNFFKKINKRYLYLLLVVAIFIKSITNSCIIYQPMILMLISYIFITKDNFFNLLLFIIVILISQTGMTSYLFASLLLFLIVVIPSINRLFNNCLFKFIIMFLAFCFVLFLLLNYDYIIYIFSKDANTIWRWRVWTNEFRNLFKTYFFGVGYGTAYVDYNIYKEVSNYNMYLINGLPSPIKLLTVGNHNSLVNIIYRSGLIGFVLFIKCLINLFKYYYNTLKKYNNKIMRFALANFVFNLLIIFLNPGFESPHFYTGFVFSLGIMIFIIYEERKKKNYE